jgi:hypothetical protein
MIASRTTELLSHLHEGSLDATDTAMLEQTSAAQLVNELRSLYPITFQERHVGKKWELSLARQFRAEIRFRVRRNGLFAYCLLVPAYVNCVMINIEDDALTGISRLSRLTVWEIAKPEPGLALKSGHGFKLDKTPDGWSLKPMRRKLVKLSGSFLQDRGWRFDHLKTVIPAP